MMLTADQLDEWVTVRDAADMCGVTVRTVYQWVERDWLTVEGLDEQGRKVFRRITVLKAERDARHKLLRNRPRLVA